MINDYIHKTDYHIEVTFDVLKFDKFNDSNKLQSQNIRFIEVTWDVSKFDKFNDINEWQL